MPDEKTALDDAELDGFSHEPDSSDLDAESSDDDSSDDVDPLSEAPALKALRKAVDDYHGPDATWTSAIIVGVGLFGLAVGCTGWLMGWLSGGQALGYGLGLMVGGLISGALIVGVVDAGLPSFVAWPIATVVLSGFGGIIVRKLGADPTTSVALGCGLAGTTFISAALFRRQHKRELYDRGIDDKLAANLKELPIEPVPMQADVEHACKGFTDIQGAVRGPLHDEPGIDADRILADAATTLSMVLERAPSVGRLLERSVEHEAVDDDAWAKADKRWVELVEELHAAAEALLVHAAQHDDDSLVAMREHVAHLRRFSSARAEVAAPQTRGIKATDRSRETTSREVVARGTKR